MATFASALESHDQRWCAIVTIEGVGDAGGLTKFCSSLPDYATAAYRPYLASMPDILSERADIMGGLPEAGNFSVELVDIDDFLTERFAVEVQRGSELTVSATVTSPAINVRNGAAFAAASHCFLGSEAMEITNVTGNILTVTRGALGTDALTHERGDIVYAQNHYLRSRRASVYLAPSDGSIGEETLVGEYVIDGLVYSSELNSYTLSGKGQLKYLHRICSSRPRRVLIGPSWADISASLGEIPIVRHANWENNPVATVPDSAMPSLVWSANNDDWQIHLWDGDAVYAVEILTDGWYRFLPVSGIAGTHRQGARPVNAVYTQVFVADPNNDRSDFRWSDPAVGAVALSRSVGTNWSPTAHWVDIILSIMMSPAETHESYLLESNATAFGNWAWMPPGYGMGIRAADVDIESFVAAKQRTPDYTFQNTIFGHESMPFGAWVTKSFLRPLGAYIVTEGGRIKLIVPRQPLVDDATTEIHTSHVLADISDDLVGRARLQVQHNMARVVATVVYQYGSKLQYSHTVTSSDFRATFGQRALYSLDERPETFEVPGASLDSRRFLRSAAARTLFRFHRPTMDVAADVTIDRFGANVGDFVSLTIPEIPTLLGNRGYVARHAEVVEREVRMSESESIYIRLRAIAYGEGSRFGRVSPSAQITSVTTNTATVLSSVFTHGDAVGGLPATDAAAFRVGDVCRLLEPDGRVVSGTGFATIVTIAANAVTLDGDFGGMLAAGRVLAYAHHDETSAVQQLGFVHYSDLDDQTPGASDDASWTYAEA